MRNKSAEILRKAERGEQFVISVDGRPVALLGPCKKQPWVAKTEYLHVLAGSADDPEFFEDIADMGGAPPELDDRWAR